MVVTPLVAVSERTVEDLNALQAELRLDAGGSPVTKERVEDLLSDKNAVMMVALDGERVAGMATLYVLPKTTKRIAHIDDVVVSSDYRGQGLGEQLMRALIEEAKKREVSSIELTSRPARVAAQKLYTKLGFEKRETDPFRLKL